MVFVVGWLLWSVFLLCFWMVFFMFGKQQGNLTWFLLKVCGWGKHKRLINLRPKLGLVALGKGGDKFSFQFVFCGAAAVFTI